MRTMGVCMCFFVDFRCVIDSETHQADGLYTYCNDKRLNVATCSLSFQVVLGSYSPYMKQPEIMIINDNHGCLGDS